MTSLLPNVEATASSLARVLRLHSGSEPQPQATRASVARRLLEELGVRCDETATLQDLKGFLLSSRRGTEIVTRRDLTDEERVQVYAHLIAHALLDADLADLQLLAHFAYVPGRAPESRSAHEERLADAVARAILDGRLEAAPRLVYCHDLGPGRGRLSRAVLRGLHTSSLALYRRSRSYQRLRSLPVFTAVTLRVHSLLGSAA
jgi:hypothetical protein